MFQYMDCSQPLHRSLRMLGKNVKTYTKATDLVTEEQSYLIPWPPRPPSDY